jgi:hypothetical protein
MKIVAHIGGYRAARLSSTVTICDAGVGQL